MLHLKFSPGRMVRIGFWVALVVITSGGCGEASRRPGGAHADSRVVVLAAASVAAAVQDVAEAHALSADARVTVVPGPSNALAQQILAGAPGHLYLPASQEWADTVADAGLVRCQQRLLTNRLVLIVPRGNPAGVASPKALLDDRVEHVALAGESVPAGKYADQTLQSLELSEPLEAAGKIVRGHDARVTLSYVARGEAEAGIVYASDAATSSEVEVVHQFDLSLHDPVIYPVVLLKSDGESGATRSFFEFLCSEEAEAIWTRYGFEPIGKVNSSELKSRVSS